MDFRRLFCVTFLSLLTGTSLQASHIVTVRGERRSHLRGRRIALLVVVCVAFAVAAAGKVHASLLVRESAYPELWGYGGSDWTDISAEMDAATGNQVIEVSDFSNAAQVNAADALWIDLGNFGLGANSSLTASEVNNITNFINTGRRVVMFGENANWAKWNGSILGVVGGTFTGSNFHGQMLPVVSNSLTSGVVAINVSVGGTEAGVAIGGTQLFDQNVATLWTPHVLTILDSVFNDEIVRNSQQNNLFMQNVVNWAATDIDPAIPEPTTSTLALAALCFAMSRRRIAAR